MMRTRATIKQIGLMGLEKSSLFARSSCITHDASGGARHDACGGARLVKHHPLPDHTNNIALLYYS